MAEASVFDPAMIEDPFPLFAQMQRDQPVAEIAPGMYIVTRYEDVKRVLRDYESFPAQLEDNNAFALFGPSPVQEQIDEIFARCPEEPVLMRRDPPYQAGIRTLVSHVFTPRKIRELEPQIQAVIDELFDRWSARDRVELVSEFAKPFPSWVTSAALGAEPEMREQLRFWADENLTRIAGPQSPERQLEVARHLAESHDYFLGLAERRRVEPRDDLMTLFVTARLADGRTLTGAEVANLATIFLVGGNETTTNLLSSSFEYLVRDPDLAQNLRSHPDRIPRFVEEMLRLESPAQGQPRGVARDVELGGAQIPAGSTLMVMFAAANRDEGIFQDAGELDIDRTYAQGCPHMAFGHANHFCLGAPLARAEVRLALETLLPRMHAIRIDPGDSVQRHPNFFLRGFDRLPLEFNAVLLST